MDDRAQSADQGACRTSVTNRRDRLAYLNAKYGAVPCGEWGEDWFREHADELRRLLDIPTTLGLVNSLGIERTSSAVTGWPSPPGGTSSMMALIDRTTRPLRLV